MTESQKKKLLKGSEKISDIIFDILNIQKERPDDILFHHDMKNALDYLNQAQDIITDYAI